VFFDWVCLPDFYEGYAVQKAKDWWEQRTNEPFPETCEEFLFLADTLISPAEIIVVREGKFDRVTECRFAELGEVDLGVYDPPPINTDGLNDAPPF
jgi:hypothetical protein